MFFCETGKPENCIFVVVSDGLRTTGLHKGLEIASVDFLSSSVQ